MSERWIVKSVRDKVRSASVYFLWSLSAIVHQTLSLVGVPVLSALLVFTFVSIARSVYPSMPNQLANSLLIQIPGYPIQVVFGFLLGNVLGRFGQRRIMLWVWVLPAILLCALLTRPIDGSGFLGPYYSPESHHRSTFLQKLSWSILLLPSAGYALGARFVKGRNAQISPEAV